MQSLRAVDVTIGSMSVRVAVVLGALAGAASGCAQGACSTCPVASLTANGSTDLSANVGDMVGYEWTSSNADTASSTVAIMPTPDN